MADGSYVGVELPSGYTRVEYLESSGTQYINSGITPSNNTRIIIRSFSTGNYSVYGSISTVGDFNLTAGSGVMYFYWAEAGRTSTGDWLNAVHTFEQNKNQCYVDGSLVHTYTDTTWSNSYPIYLFGRNSSGSLNDAGGTVRIYSCRLYDNGTLVRYFVPCKNSSGVYGLYDLANDKFYTNAGSGTFAAGATVSGGVARKNKTGYIGIENQFRPAIPSDYTRVEYIESSGTQYIDTGVTIKSTLVSKLKFNMTAVTGYVIYGNYSGSDTDDYRLFNASGKCYLDFPSGSRIYGGTMSANVDYEVEVGNYYVKDITTGENIISGSAVTFSEQTITAKMWWSSLGCSSGKLYYLKIYDNGVLVRDFVPCKNASGTIGLYDLVNDKFYTNAGSGSFSCGNEVYGVYTQVDYIESTGTQYIDTGFTPNQDTRVVMDFDLVSVPNGSWATLFAARDNSNNNGFGLYQNAALTQLHETYASQATYNGVVTGRHLIDKNKNNTSIDGTVVKTHTYTTFTAPVPLRLLYDVKPNGGDKHPAAGKLYSCKIYNNGTLARDFVPCVSNPKETNILPLATDNYYIMQNGSHSGTDTNWVSSDKIPVTAGMKVKFGIVGHTIVGSVIAYDSAGSVIGYVSGSTNNGFFESEYVVPFGATHITITGGTTNLTSSAANQYVSLTGAAGLYDRANDTFYPNAGSGTFNAGSTSYERDSSTLLLINGSHAGDLSVYQRGVTCTGVVASTDITKFGDSSLYFNGSSRLLIPAFDFFDGDWTIDWWEYPTSSSSKARFSSAYITGTNVCGGLLLGYSGTRVYASTSADSSSWNLIAGSSMLQNTLNAWTHWAFVKSGTALKSYKNGTLYATATLSSKVGFSSSYPFAIGDYREKDAAPFIGYMDAFRISNIARWTSDFTPPAKGYELPRDGSDGIARKIKKAYVGVDGVARQIVLNFAS